MQSIQYMTRDGDFAASCGEGTPCPHPDWIEAPPGGAYGMRWDGKAWAEDAGTEARVEAELAAFQGRPVPVDMTPVSRLQFELAAGQTLWQRAEEYAASPECPWEMARVIRSATTVAPGSENLAALAYLLGVDDAALAEILARARTIEP